MFQIVPHKSWQQTCCPHETRPNKKTTSGNSKIKKQLAVCIWWAALGRSQVEAANVLPQIQGHGKSGSFHDCNVPNIFFTLYLLAHRSPVSFPCFLSFCQSLWIIVFVCANQMFTFHRVFLFFWFLFLSILFPCFWFRRIVSNFRGWPLEPWDWTLRNILCIPSCCLWRVSCAGGSQKLWCELVRRVEPNASMLMDNAWPSQHVRRMKLRISKHATSQLLREFL